MTLSRRIRATAFSGAVCLLVGCGTGHAGLPNASSTATFRDAVNLGPPINSQDFDGGPSLSADGLTLYFVTDRDIVTGGDIWTATRRSAAEPFGQPRNLGSPVNSAADEGSPAISADGLDLFYDRAPDGRIFEARRSIATAPFGKPVIVDLVCSGCRDGFPAVSSDALQLYFCSDRAGGYGGDDVWMATRASTSSPFEPPVNVGPAVNSAANDCEPTISTDGRELFFGSDRKGGSGGDDIWVSSRSSPAQPFRKTVNAGREVNSGFSDQRPYLSPDGATLLFMSDRPGGLGSFDLWQVSRTASS